MNLSWFLHARRQIAQQQFDGEREGYNIRLIELKDSVAEDCKEDDEGEAQPKGARCFRSLMQPPVATDHK